MDYKDWLIDMFYDFVDEHGREPTQEEIDGAYSDRCESICDCYQDELNC